MSVLARYLSGRLVTRAELRDAWEDARRDAGAIETLARTLGTGDVANECDAFLSSVAEFASLSLDQLRHEMPELVSHLTTCAECRGAYWRVRPPWMAEALATAARASNWLLASTIRVAVDATGALRQSNIGPPAFERMPVAATAARPISTGQGATLEWGFEQDDQPVTIHLTLSPSEGADRSVGVVVRLAGEAAPSSQQLRVDVRARPTERTVLATRLADIEGEPVVLPPGQYTLRVKTTGTPSQSWSMVLDIEAVSSVEGADDDQ